MQLHYHSHIKFNIFDVVKYTKPKYDKLEENDFTIRLMTRQYNAPYGLDRLYSELGTIMQEQEMNQSGWSIQRFFKKNYVLCIYTAFILVMNVM